MFSSIFGINKIILKKKAVFKIFFIFCRVIISVTRANLQFSPLIFSIFRLNLYASFGGFSALVCLQSCQLGENFLITAAAVAAA